MSEDKVYSITDFNTIINNWYLYLKSKFAWITLIGIIAVIAGIIYAWQQPPKYIAKLTFVSDIGRSSLGAYAGLASQFGIDLGGGGEGVFEGDNLMELLRSQLLVQKTFLTQVTINGKKQSLVDYFSETRGFRNLWAKDAHLKKVTFDNFEHADRARDSILKVFYYHIIVNALTIEKVDRRLNIIAATVTDYDEVFAKIFVEQLVNNAIQYYTNFKSQKARQNVQILQRQTDSVRSLVNGSMVSIAASNDLNVNPLRELPRVNMQGKRLDVQVNTALYGELVKNLELSRMVLRKETPFIQIIDTPILPLEKKQLSKLKGALIFGFIGISVAFLFFIIRGFSIINKNKTSLNSDL